ncbi:hypothetical protein KAF25_010928 [Fusarium avenaceum]|uniref:AAA+ ATPase domain-containing protein n=1 Tax=Fusarium avenaceum TaxID=40199 RepID=A0A9P7GQZ5_9HYPO|nr:hypothetical protein KAF25_010928 [Fusarium avenaceum]
MSSQNANGDPDCQSDTSSISSVVNAPTLSASIGQPITLDGQNPKGKKLIDDVNIRLQAAIHRDNSPNLKPSNLKDGEKCEIKTLYEGPAKCRCCKNWVEEYPDDLGTNIEKQTGTTEKALVVRKRKSHSEGRLLELDSVIVQSPSLKQTLSELFDDYQGITTSLKKLVLKAPFHPFYHRWNKFSDILERQKKDDPTSYSFSKLLYDVLHVELRDEMDEIGDHIEKGIITYDFLWALFEPGSIIFSLVDGKERFFIVSSHGYNSKDGYFGISAKFIDWNGQRFGYNNQTFGICQFSGTEHITELEVYPASFHPSKSDAHSRAIDRGRKFQGLRGTHYKAYSGSASFEVRRNQSIQRKASIHIEERVVVDAAAYLNAVGRSMRLDSLAEKSIRPSLRVTDDKHIGPPDDKRGRPEDTMSEAVLDLFGMAPYGKEIENKRHAAEPEEKQVNNLNEKQLLLCNSKVKGYPLKTKIWGIFEVDDIGDITWNDDAFSNLVLPSGYRDLVTSFVEGQATDAATFDDIIQGKGLGIVILLVGSPGTGKTLTAEAVADKARKPLYVLSAGELGNQAESVETRLEDVLRLAEKWNAVLLFDECDVFLQARSVSNLEHNEIVAVFLRVIEYYRGILILTTSRGDAIDEAFKSRIHLTLHYPELDATAREKIWRRCTIVSKIGSSLSSQEFVNLSQLSMNGRQIRNVVKISIVLAGKEKSQLGIKQIRTVLEATQENNGRSLDVLSTDGCQE